MPTHPLREFTPLSLSVFFANDFFIGGKVRSENRKSSGRIRENGARGKPDT